MHTKVRVAAGPTLIEHLPARKGTAMSSKPLHLKYCLEYLAIKVVLSINLDLSSACICYNCRCCSVKLRLQIIYYRRTGTKVSS